MRELLNILIRMVFPKRCPECYWRCVNDRALAYHLYVDHAEAVITPETAEHWRRFGIEVP